MVFKATFHDVEALDSNKAEDIISKFISAYHEVFAS